MAVLKEKLSEEDFKKFTSGDRTLVKQLMKKKNVPFVETERTQLDTQENEN
jgi:hypothetical protein